MNDDLVVFGPAIQQLVIGIDCRASGRRHDLYQVANRYRGGRTAWEAARVEIPNWAFFARAPPLAAAPAGNDI